MSGVAKGKRFCSTMPGAAIPEVCDVPVSDAAVVSAEVWTTLGSKSLVY